MMNYPAKARDYDELLIIISCAWIGWMCQIAVSGSKYWHIKHFLPNTGEKMFIQSRQQSVTESHQTKFGIQDIIDLTTAVYPTSSSAFTNITNIVIGCTSLMR